MREEIREGQSSIMSFKRNPKHRSEFNGPQENGGTATVSESKKDEQDEEDGSEESGKEED